MSKVKMTKVADLRKHPSYAQIYAAKSPQFDLLVSSIEDTGELLEPIVITSDKIIISGVQRWLAYQKLGRELIPAIIYDGADDMDMISLIISFNQYRSKSTLEKWNEIQHLKKRFGKRQGQRTDLIDSSSCKDRLTTRAFIAQQMGISEGNVHKIEKVAQNDRRLFTLIDTKEISLHEAYERIKPKSDSNSIDVKSDLGQGEPTESAKKCCPTCKREF